MGYREVWIDEEEAPDIDSVLAEYGDADWRQFVDDWSEEISHALGSDSIQWLNDPVKRLGVIVELRRMGYSVEGGGA